MYAVACGVEQRTVTPLTKLQAVKLVKKWECLGSWSFPRTQEGLEALAEALVSITGTLENAEKLTQRVLMGCSRCPTPIELRKIMSSKIGPPADGLHECSLDATDLMSGGGKKDV